MNYQIYGDLLTIYFENGIAQEEELARLLDENEVEWIVVDCEKISELNADMLNLLVVCTSGVAEVIAINANETVARMLRMCFVEVSLGFHYIPDANNIRLLLNGKSLDMDFVNNKIFDFLLDQKIEDDEEMSLHKKITDVINFVKENGAEVQRLEINCTVLEEKIVIDVTNKLSGKHYQIEDVIDSGNKNTLEFEEFLDKEHVLEF